MTTPEMLLEAATAYQEGLLTALNVLGLVLVLSLTAAFACNPPKELSYDEELEKLYAKRRNKRPLKERLAKGLFFWKRNSKF